MPVVTGALGMSAILDLVLVAVAVDLVEEMRVVTAAPG